MALNIDYSDKLNDHESYLNILKLLQKKCDYIELLIIDGKDKESNPIVREFKDDIILVRKGDEGYSTLNNIVYLKSSKKIFDYLAQYETFCKFYKDKKVENDCDRYENTDFGFDDIGFYDKDGNILLGTITHECSIGISDELLN